MTRSRLDESAEKLACLLIETVEFQRYVRLSRAVSQDEQIRMIQNRINDFQVSYFSSVNEEGDTLQYLYTQMENQPLMREFRQAEKAIRELFREVDRAISQEAGVDFAANARVGCG